MENGQDERLLVVKALFWLRAVGGSKRFPLMALLIIACLLGVVACDFGSTNTKDVSTPIPAPDKTQPASSTSQNPIPDSSPSGNGAGQPSPAPAGSATVASSTDLSSIWGGELHLSAIPVLVDKSYYLTPNSITPDGKDLVCIAYPFEGPESGLPSKLLLMDVASKQVAEIRRSPQANIIIYSASADANWIIWTEAPHEPGFFSEWTIYAYNRRDRSVKEVAKAGKNSDGMPLVGTDGSAKLDHNVVAWAETTSETLGKDYAVVKTMNLISGETAIVSERGRSPMLSWPYIVWTETEDVSTEQPEALNKRILIAHNLETGTREKLNGLDTPKAFALHDEELAWITHDNKLILTDLGGTSEATLANVEGDSISLSLNDRLIVWYSDADTSNTQVWDRLQGKLIELPTMEGTHYFLGANSLFWTPPLPQDANGEPLAGAKAMINVLDTSKLPK